MSLFPDTQCQCSRKDFEVISGRGVCDGIVWLLRCKHCGHEWEVFQREN